MAHATFDTHNLILIPELLLLVQLPLYKALIRGVIVASKVHELLGFGSVVKSEIHIFLFFTLFMILFLLVSTAFMVTWTGLWYRLIDSPHLDCLSLQPIWCVPGPTWRLGSLMYRSNLCSCLVACVLAKKPVLDTRTDTHQGDRKSAGETSTSSIYPKKGHCWGQCLWCFTVNIFITILIICCAGWYTSKKN